MYIDKKIRLYANNCENYFFSIFINNRRTYSGKLYRSNNSLGKQCLYFKPSITMSFEIEDLEKIIKIMKKYI